MLASVCTSSVRGFGCPCPVSNRSACVLNETIFTSVIFKSVLLGILERARGQSADKLPLHHNQEDEHGCSHHCCRRADDVERHAHTRHLPHESDCCRVFAL